MTKRNWTISIIYFIVVVLTLVLRIVYALGFAQFFPIDSDYLFTIIVQIFIFGLVPFVAFLLSEFRFSNNKLSPIKSLSFHFGLCKRVGLKNWLRTFAISALMVFSASFISWMWQAILAAFGFTQVSTPVNYNSLGVLFMQLLMVGVLPAFFEEFTHRGLLFAGLKTNRLNDGWKVILISAVLFSLMHQNIRQTGYTFYDGIIMALLCYYTGSIFPAVFAHFYNNALSVISNYCEQNGGFYNIINRVYDFLMASPLGFAIFLISFLASLALLFLLFYTMRKDFLKEQKKLRVSRAILDGAIVLTSIEQAEGESQEYVVEKKNIPVYLLGLDITDKDIVEAYISSQGKTSADFILPEDYSSDFAPKDKQRKNVWLFTTILVGIACSLFSLAWGLLR